MEKLTIVCEIRGKILMAFGKHLSEMRRQKNISQEQLAYDADISLSSISKIERGILNISVFKAYLIAQALTSFGTIQIRPAY